MLHSPQRDLPRFRWRGANVFPDARGIDMRNQRQLGIGGRRRAGFTMVEIIVVTAIIGTLMAIMLPALINARASSMELKSIVQLTRLCDMVIFTHVEEQKKLPEWKRDEDGFIRSKLNSMYGFDPASFEDPFRRTHTIAEDPLLARLGPFVNADHPPDGFGFFYVPFSGSFVWDPDGHHFPVNSISHPMWDSPLRVVDEDDPSWTNLQIPNDTEYLIWGVGRNGKLDGDPALDLVLIKTPQYENVQRHRPSEPKLGKEKPED